LKRNTSKKKASRKKPASPRLPISAKRLKRLGYACDHLTDADEAAKISVPLAELIDKHDHLAAAWERGQLLRNLEAFAGAAVSVTQAARKLGFEKGQDLRKLLDTDAEVNNIWEQTRLETLCAAKAALVDAAKEGNQAAIRAVEIFLRDEGEVPQGAMRFDSVQMKQFADLFGVSRQAVHEWITKQGLPRNADGSFDLATAIAWHTDHLTKKAAPTKGALSVADKYRMEKIEAEREKRRRARGELLDRIAVLQRFNSIIISMKAELDRLVRDHPPLLANKPPMHIETILAKFRDEFIQKQRKVPDEFKLPPAAQDKLVAFYDEICPVQDAVEESETETDE